MRYLAIDLGAESGRGVVGNLERRAPRAPQRCTAFPTSRSASWTGCTGMCSSLYTQIKQAIGLAAREGPEPLRGIGIDSWGVDYGLLTSDGSLVGLPYHYRDGRTDGVMERAFAIVPQSEIFRQTGIQFLQFNTLFQLLAAKEQACPVAGGGRAPADDRRTLYVPFDR